jgi:2'-5' RNA ligase
MRTLCKVSLALGLAVLLARPAVAQFRGGGGGGIGGLLTNKSVQEELKLDKDQVDKVAEALKKVREDLKDEMAKLRDRDTPREERATLMRKVGEAEHKALDGILKAEQTKRLHQIQLQLEGVGAFANAETQKALNLTDKQKEDLKAIQEDLQKEQREIFQNAGDDRQAAFKKIQTLRKDKLDAALKVLTDEQKKTYKEMTGEHFEIRFEPPRGR